MEYVTCERAGYDYYNRYRPRNISELHELSTVTCSLLTLGVGIDIVVMASIKPQSSADVFENINRFLSL